MPVWIVQLIIMAITMVLSYALRPKIAPPNPATAADFTVPVVENGKVVDVIFGDCWVDDPNIVWWGDLLSIPIYLGGKKGH